MNTIPWRLSSISEVLFLRRRARLSTDSLPRLIAAMKTEHKHQNNTGFIQAGHKHEQLKEVKEQEASSCPTKRFMFPSILHAVASPADEQEPRHATKNKSVDKLLMSRVESVVEERRSCAKASKPRRPMELSEDVSVVTIR